MGYDIFISYRRANISYARNIYYALKDKGYTNIFFDMDSVREGLFPDQIRDAVKGCTNFILVLSPGSMDRCANIGDWVAEEVSLALEYEKNILPVVIGISFTWPSSFPARLEKLKQYQDLKLIEDYFNEGIDKLVRRFRTKVETVSEKKDSETYANAKKIASHEYVDLGLPSGTLWATCNVGATKPWEFGDYFAWGETAPKKDYSLSTYKWSRSSTCDIFTKYVASRKYGTVDNKKVLEAADDAATANWGSAWRMPTSDEIKELLDGCDWEWTEDFNGTGVAGRIGTSKANGNKIFLPAAGIRFTPIVNFKAGDDGFYCSSTLDEYHSLKAYCLYFNDSDIRWICVHRYHGVSVRAVVK